MESFIVTLWFTSGLFIVSRTTVILACPDGVSLPPGSDAILFVVLGVLMGIGLILDKGENLGTLSGLFSFRKSVVRPADGDVRVYPG